VRPIFSRLAISRLLIPVTKRRLISALRPLTIGGRPWGLPCCLASAIPAFTLVDPGERGRQIGLLVFWSYGDMASTAEKTYKILWCRECLIYIN
jgi:hypothetical protein